MTLRITVVDVDSGTTDEKLLEGDDYLLICAGACYLDSAQTHRGGCTHVLTLKGRRPDSPVNVRVNLVVAPS